MKKAGFFILLYLLSYATYAGVYQWTDENGHVHFGSVPPTLQDEYSLGDEIKPAAKKTLVEPARLSQPTTDKSEQVKIPAQVETTAVSEMSVPKETTASKTSPVRDDELKTLITRLRNDAGEIEVSEDQEAGKIQKVSGPESQLLEKTAVVTPGIAPEPEPEISGDDVAVESQDLLNAEIADALIVEAEKITPEQKVEVAADEIRAVLKHQKKEIKTPVIGEVPQLVSAQETKKSGAEDHPVKKYFVEEKAGNILLDEDLQFSSDQTVETNEVENQSGQESLAEAENVLPVEASWVESDQTTDSGEGELRLAEELAPEAVQDVDKCGLFMGFVEQYKIKKSEGCPGPHCDVYKRQLKKFKLKQQRYC